MGALYRSLSSFVWLPTKHRRIKSLLPEQFSLPLICSNFSCGSHGRSVRSTTRNIRRSPKVSKKRHGKSEGGRKGLKTKLPPNKRREKWISIGENTRLSSFQSLSRFQTLTFQFESF